LFELAMIKLILGKLATVKLTLDKLIMAKQFRTLN
jgi:hypothetical protein